jgi:hypothetical protein
MIIALQPKQVSIFWDSIKHAFSNTNPCPDNVDPGTYYNNLFENLLTQKYTAWLLFKYGKDNEKLIYAIGITNIQRDELTGSSTLHIMSLYGFRKLDDDLAKESFVEFMKYARNTECHRVQARSTVPRIHSLAETVGFKRSYQVYNYPIRRPENGR